MKFIGDKNIYVDTSTIISLIQSVILLKKEIDVTNLVVNDKTKTKDTWESAFCYIDIINLPLYDFDALKDIFDETSSEDYENDRSLVFE